MSNLFLMVQNPGVAPSEAFTLLGASTKRGHANSNMIGKFGTGNKQAIGVCLRNGLSPVVYAGNLRMEFSTRQQVVKNTTFNRVVVKFSGKDADGTFKTSTEDLGYVLEHGSDDWQSIDLGLREFVSNAIDQAIEEGENAHLVKFVQSQVELHGDFDVNSKENIEKCKQALVEYRKTAKDYKNVEMAIVDESKVRAKSGYTRVFIPVNSDVFSFYENIDKWFLHFKSDDLLGVAILPKTDRNLSGNKSAVIYRRGVRVREIEIDAKDSLFDYNLEDLKLDESRKCDDYQVSYRVASVWAKAASINDVATLFQSALNQSNVWELGLDFEYGMSCFGNSNTKKVWADAWIAIAGDNAVICGKGAGEMARRKGYRTLEASDKLVKGAELCGIATPATKLTQDQQNGIEIFDSPPMANMAVDFAWQVCEQVSMTNGRTKPQVKSFRKIMDGGGQTLGFYRDNTVFMNIDLVDGHVEYPQAIPNQTLVTAFEEVAHHITGATDNSRDFQDFAFNMVMLLAKRTA